MMMILGNDTGFSSTILLLCLSLLPSASSQLARPCISPPCDYTSSADRGMHTSTQNGDHEIGFFFKKKIFLRRPGHAVSWSSRGEQSTHGWGGNTNLYISMIAIWGKASNTYNLIDGYFISRLGEQVSEYHICRIHVKCKDRPISYLANQTTTLLYLPDGRNLAGKA